MLRVGVLVSGGGTNLQAILDWGHGARGSECHCKEADSTLRPGKMFFFLKAEE